jgi:hypothetical protein
MENAVPINRCIDDVTDRPRASNLEKNRVNPADVIGKKEKSARWKTFQPDRSNAIKATGN